MCCRNVSQDLSELIVTMVQNCSVMLSKNSMNRPPPPGVLRHRTLDTFPVTLGSQVSLFYLFSLSVLLTFKLFSYIVVSPFYLKKYCFYFYYQFNVANNLVIGSIYVI